MLIIEPYTSSCQAEWDALVNQSKNATFLLRRDYMDYHSDRFPDRSLMIRDSSSGRLVTVLPATVTDGALVSHAGLTYGGFVMSATTHGHEPLEWIEMVADYCRQANINRLVYKPAPSIYHTLPAEEDLYALWRAGAQISVRNLSTVIDLRRPVASSRLMRRAAKRQSRFAITVAETRSVADFWPIIVADRAERHNTSPAHTAEEMQLLHDRLPDCVRFFVARANGEVAGGAVVYVCGSVLHLQYAACTPAGRDIYATDVIYHHLISGEFPGATHFDFGTSNEQSGQWLNAGMVAHKEELGGRSIVYDTYTLNIK